MAERHQVIVIGGGPVGVAMGLDLGMRGVDVVVVGRHLLPQRIPKGQVHASLDDTMRTLLGFRLFSSYGATDDDEATFARPGYERS